MMTSDSENKMKISHNNETTSNTSSNVTHEVNKIESKSEFTTSPSSPTSCSGNELRCVSGKCITVDQLCDKVMDCPDGEDELMCTYEERPKPKKP